MRPTRRSSSCTSAPNRTVYDAGHIPGARFVSLHETGDHARRIPNELAPVDDLKKIMETAGVSDDSRVILYSDVSVLPATRAYFTLDYLGHGDQAALLDGGLEKWRKEGRPVTRMRPPRTRADSLRIPAGTGGPDRRREADVQQAGFIPLRSPFGRPARRGFSWGKGIAYSRRGQRFLDGEPDQPRRSSVEIRRRTPEDV